MRLNKVKSKVSRIVGIIKTRADINEIESSNQWRISTKPKAVFFKQINKIDMPLIMLKKKDNY